MVKMTLKQATEIAEGEITQIIKNSERLSRYEFGPVRFRRENPAFWVFSAGSQQLIEEGCIPGAVFACVDKTEGHLWNREEQEQYFENVRLLQQAAQPDAVAA